MRYGGGDRTVAIDLVDVYFLFGSNLGDRRRSIDQGLARLEQGGVTWMARSSFYETEPVGIEDQPWFMNLAAHGKSTLSPRSLLGLCKEAEAAEGRRDGVRNGPRPLDVDILLYDEIEVAEPDLVIPHPRLRERRFALIPLLEIAPDLADFRDRRPYAEVLRGLDERKKVAKSKTRES